MPHCCPIFIAVAKQEQALERGRTSPPTTLTERGYTGHHENRDIGLTYMNARYYIPGLGRFLTADTIVPAPANPQSHNRYTYVLGNPLVLVDPTGHCPAPTPENGYTGSGHVICLAGFIPTAYSQGPFNLIFVGDNRDFSHNSTTTQSRFWIWIDVETGEYQYYIHPTVATNDRWGLGDCEEQICIYQAFGDSINDITVDILLDGTIRVTYSILCSHPLCLLGPGPDGWIDFIPDGNGGYTTAGSVERFPNLEAYLWRNGQLQTTLFQYQNFSPDELTSGIASIETGFWMYGGLGQRHSWNIPPSHPHIPFPTNPNGFGGGGGRYPFNGWYHLPY
ncbi:MAG: RHS repeat-associated core domain-containing protein [Anaerolineae bacterium]|nr:RHS repeat-associated core domain-containing protein [Anaerolineae bacterium]